MKMLGFSIRNPQSSRDAVFNFGFRIKSIAEHSAFQSAIRNPQSS